MKIYKFLLLTIILSLTACEKDGGDSVLELENGALSNFTLDPESPELIINTIFPSTNLKFSTNLVYGNPDSFDLNAIYQTLGGAIYGPVLLDEGETDFSKEYDISGSEIISAFSELNSASDMQPGDNLIIYPSFKLKDGRILGTLDDQARPNYFTPNFDNIENGAYTYYLSFSVICAPQPGTYRIDMHDSYGDGWQTNDGNGGNGLQLILDGVVTQEVGLCNPYVANPYNCVSDYSNGSADLIIPEGTESAVWQFPGDYYGEISFEIYAPDGSLLLASGLGEASGGALSVVLCAE